MIDNLTRILLEKHQPDSPLLKESLEALQAPEGAFKPEVSPAYSQTNRASPNALQSVVCKSATGNTTTMTVIMSSEDYTGDEITFGCMAFNILNPTLMSKSYQLLVAFEGIPAGSWVYVTTRKG